MKTQTQKTELVEVLTGVTDFTQFMSLEGGTNRKVSKTHVHDLVGSYQEFGSASATVIVVESTCLGGKTERIIVDGQHSIRASMICGVPLIVIVVRLVEDTLINLTKYISVLNNKKRGWSPKIYLESYARNEIREYQVILNCLVTYDLTISDLLYIFLGGSGGKHFDNFKSGDMVFPNQAQSLEILLALQMVKDIIPNKSFVRRGFYRVIRTTKNYKNFAMSIRNSNVVFSENEKEFALQLKEIAKSQLLPVVAPIKQTRGKKMLQKNEENVCV